MMNKLLFVGLVAFCVPAFVLAQDCYDDQYYDETLNECVFCKNTYAPDCIGCSATECLCQGYGKKWDPVTQTCSCPIGTYEDANHVCQSCKDIFPGCYYCTDAECLCSGDNKMWDPVNNVCTCVPGSYESNGNCVLCTDQYGPNCVACTDSQCLCNGENKYYDETNHQCLCLSGSYPSGENCIPCTESLHCKTCSDASSCSSCQFGYTENSGVCELNCQEKYPEVGFCTECNDDFCTNCNDEGCCIHIGKLWDVITQSCQDCPAGQYAVSSNECQECPPSTDTHCATCASPSSCTSCIAGYFLSVAGGMGYCKVNCSAKYDEGCTSCDDYNCYDCNTLDCCNGIGKIWDATNSACHGCEEGYYPDTTANECVACNPGLHCATCTDDTSCSSCVDGYDFDVDDGECILNCHTKYGEHCSQCDDDVCTNCDDQTCCNSIGKVWDGNPATCHDCAVGQYADGNECKSCTDGLHCAACTNGTACSQCATGYVFDSEGVCKVNCGAKYGEHCIDCNDDVCLDCNDQTCCNGIGKIWDATNSVCHDCEEGNRPDIANNVCVPCGTGLHCKACTDDTSCTSCVDGYDLNVDECVLNCHTKYGEHCIDCDDDVCTNCDNQTCCNSIGKVWDDAESECYNCVDGYYADNNTNECAPCSAGLHCVTCINATSCASCEINYTISGTEGCVLDCVKLHGDGCTSCNLSNCEVCKGEKCCSNMNKLWKDNACVEKPEEEEEGGLELWMYIVIGVGGVVVAGLLIFGLICLGRYCYKEKGPSVGVATSSHDVLFDDEDDIDLTPVSKKTKKNADDDAFI